MLTIHQVTIRIVCFLHLIGSIIWIGFEVFFTRQTGFTYTHFKSSINSLPAQLFL